MTDKGTEEKGDTAVTTAQQGRQMKKLLLYGLAVIALSALAIRVGSDIHASWSLRREQERAKAANRAQTEASLAQLVANYNAVRGWENSISKLFDEAVYTVDVKNVLVRDDGRPVLSLAEVYDVAIEDSTYYVHLRPWPGPMARADVLFVLACDNVQAARLLSRRPRMLERYGVVARIFSVHRAEFEIAGPPLGSGDVRMSLEPSQVFIAYGELLDSVFVGNYGLVDGGPR